MPYIRPTLKQLKAQVAQNINADLPGADSLLRFSNLGVLGQVQAGLAHQHYGYLDYIAQQATPYTATGEYLAAWGALKGTYLKPATQASGQVTFPAASSSVTIPSGTPISRSDGTAYTVDFVVIQTPTSITVGITANADLTGLTGAFGNCVSGSGFVLGQAIAGITSTGTSAAITGGNDIETSDAFRTRVINVYQNPVQGGARSDYETWSLEVPGVTRAWCIPLVNGAGTVGIFTMWDVTEAAFGGVPQGTNGGATEEARTAPATGDQLTVANYIYPLRAATALVYSMAPTLSPINMSIKGVASANQAAVQVALAAQIFSSATPKGCTIELNDLWAAATGADTTDDFLILSPTADTIFGVGELPALGTITWS